MRYTVYRDVQNMDLTEVSRHRSLKAAGKSFIRARSTHLSRVIDSDNNDVTVDALMAARGY